MGEQAALYKTRQILFRSVCICVCICVHVCVYVYSYIPKTYVCVYIYNMCMYMCANVHKW